MAACWACVCTWLNRFYERGEFHQMCKTNNKLTFPTAQVSNRATTNISGAYLCLVFGCVSLVVSYFCQYLPSQKRTNKYENSQRSALGKYAKENILC